MASPNTADIRKFLTEFFSDEELTILCFDYFRDVYEDLAVGMAKGQKVQLLLECCVRREALPNLLAALHAERTAQYEARFGALAPAAEPRLERPHSERDPRQVFISHAHEDAEFAHRLAADLEARGWRAWIAPDSILPGEKWAEAINRGLEACGVFIVVLTPMAVRSSWVVTETNVAIELDHKGLLQFVPAEIESCDVPLLWSAYQFISFRGNYEAGLAALVSQLGKSHGIAPVTETMRESEQPTTTRREGLSKAASVATEKWLRPEATQSAPVPLPKRTSDKAVKRRVPSFVWVGLAGLLLLAGVVFGSSALRLGRPKAPPATVAGAAMVPSLTPRLVPPTQALPTLTSTPVPPTPTTKPALPTPRPTLGLGSTRVSEKDGMVMVYVPAGEFLMGSTDAETEAYGAQYYHERPQHKVFLDAFWIDRTEVTNAMFARFVAEIGHKTEAENFGQSWVFNITTKQWEAKKGTGWQHPLGPGSDIKGLEQHPVVHVSWDDAVAYCRRAGRRLPTEAEWEKAARGTDGRKYPWGTEDVAGNLLNFADRNLDVSWADKSVDDGYQLRAPVGTYSAGASPYGALDMAGNVWEWVADWYNEQYYANSPAENPLGPDSGDVRVLRGGSWFVDRGRVRTAVRYWSSPVDTHDSVGFRCVRSP